MKATTRGSLGCRQERIRPHLTFLVQRGRNDGTAMRLSELEPRWQVPIRVSVMLPTGVSFLCPCWRGRRLSVPFTNPIDPGGLLSNTGWQPTGRSWQRTGDTFDTLSVYPSVDYSGSGHWHGNIIAGEIQ